MIPNTDTALRMLSQRLMTQLLPDLKSTYSMSDGMMVGLLMNAVADEMSEGIHRRMTDIDEMLALLADVPLDDSQRQILNGELADYRLASVNARHDQLTRLLIDVQTWAEESENRDLQQQIWAYLRRHAERHQVTAIP